MPAEPRERKDGGREALPDEVRTLDSARVALRGELSAVPNALTGADDAQAALLLQAACPMAITRGPEHVFAHVNQAWAALFSGRHLPGRAARDVLPELGHAFHASQERVFTTGVPFTARELPIPAAPSAEEGREPASYDVILSPLRDGDGAIHGLLLVGHDVTAQVAARLRAEALAARLEAERSALEAAIRHMPLGVLIAEAPSGKLLLHNERLRQLLGAQQQPFESVDSYGAFRAFFPNGQPLAAQDWPLARALEGESLKGELIRIPRPDGSFATLEASASPIRDASGRITAAVALCNDVSDRLRRQARTSRLQAVTSALSRSVTPGEVAVAMVSEAMEQLAAGGGVLYALDPDGGLRALHGVGLAGAPWDALRSIPPGARLPCQDAVRDNAPVWMGSAEALRERYPGMPAGALASGHLAWVAVPVAAGARVGGCLMLAFTEARALDAEDLTFLIAIAHQGGQALERARLYEQLEHTEARFRSLVQASAQLVWTTDAEGRVVERPLSREPSGGRPDERRGDDWIDAVHPEDRERIRREWRDAVARKQPAEFVCRVPGADGAYAPSSVRAVPILDPDRSVREWVGTNTDLSQKEQAELDRQQLVSALESNDRLLRAVLEQMPSGFLLAEGDGRPVYANARAEAIWGHPLLPSREARAGAEYRPHRLDGTQYLPEELPLARAVRRGEAVQGEVLWLRRGERDDRFIRVNAAPIRDASGKTVAGVALFENITEARRAEQRAHLLAEAGAKLSGSLEYEATLDEVARLAVPDFADWASVDLLDSDGGIRRVAVAHSEPEKVRLGYSMFHRFPSRYDDAAGVGMVIRTGATDFQAEVEDAYLARIIADPELLGILRGLSLRCYIVVPMTARGRTLGAITFVMAESERRYTQADILVAQELGRRAGVAVDNARLYREAQEASRLKDEFLSTLSHELRTPLTAILGWAHILATPALAPERRGRAIQVIERNARVQAQLVEDLLDMSRIITGKLRLQLEPTEPVPVIEAAIDAVRPAMDAKGIRLEVALDAEVGLVLVDASRLQQVVWNLLSNSVKFTGENGWMRLQLSRVGAQVELSVRDNGQGIEQGFLPFVFDRFRQAEGHTMRRHGGLGLGLAIVRHLVELHGGVVAAESPGVGQGSLFTVRLPAAPGTSRASVPAVRLRAELPAPLVAKAELSGARILVVEDEADARELVAATLEGCGAAVRGVASAAEALAAFEQSPPDVVVSDIGMEEVDGHELIRLLRGRAPGAGGRVPAIALTAYSRSEERARALAAGFDVHLTKPVEPSELIGAVAALIRRARA